MDVLVLGPGSYAVYIKARELAARKLDPMAIDRDDACRLMREALSHLPDRALIRAKVEAMPGKDELLLLVHLQEEQTVRVWFPDRRSLLAATLRCPADLPTALYTRDGGYLLVLQLPFGTDCPKVLLWIGREWDAPENGEPPEAHAQCIFPSGALGALRAAFPFPPSPFPNSPRIPS